MSANKSSINQRGFGVIGILLLIVMLMLVTGASWLVARQNSSKNKRPDTATTRQATATKSYTDSARLYSLTYPSAWSANEDVGGGDGEPKDYTKISRGVTFTPTDRVGIHGYGLNIQADATDILAKTIAQHWADNKHTPEVRTINNYSAKYVKITFNGDAENYVDHNYLLAHEGKSIFISFREKYYHQYPKEEWTASRDMSAFNAIVNSVTFK